MKKAFLLVAIGLALALSVSPVGAVSFTGTPSPSLSPVFGTLVNFDDKATGTAVLATDYLALGVASITETESLGFFGRYSGSQSSPNYVGTGSGGERGTDAAMGWDGTILIQLVNPADRVGIGIADSSGGPETISIYDSAMVLLESFVMPTGSNTYGGFTRGGFDITYFAINGDFFAIDDLQFNSKSVPEPSTLLLLGSGLIGLGYFGRKRMKRK